MEKPPRLVIFAAGTSDPKKGGTGARKLIEAARNTPHPKLDAEITGLISTHGNGSVRALAEEFEIPFRHLDVFGARNYRAAVESFSPDFIALSGWLKPVFGLNPRTTFNIHPGPLPRFGGKGMYGKHVHEAVLAAYQRGEIEHSMVTMHFITEEYDQGPIFFEKPVPILPDDTVETLAERVSETEHRWQAVVTDMVVNGEISWNPQDPKRPIGRIFPNER